MFDPIRIAMAFLPLGCYFAVMGLLRWRKYPTLLSRSFDFLLLGMGCVGLVAIGPMALFFPRAAYSLLGNWVWLVLLGLYFLVLLLIVFNVGSGFVVYGMDRGALKERLAHFLDEHGVEHTWQEDALLIESLGIHGLVEEAGMSDTASFTAIGQKQNALEWIRLEQELAQSVQSVAPKESGSGKVMLCLCVATFLLSFGCLAQDTKSLQNVVALFFEE